MKKILTFVLLLPLLVSAQYEFYNEGGTVCVQKGGLLHVDGTITNINNSNTAVVSNDGVIEVLGNFVNGSGAKFEVSGDTTSRDRAVKFIGTGTQTIQGNMSTAGSASFYNLVLDAADSVEMQTPVVIEGSLVFGTTNITSTYDPTSFYTNNGHTGLLKTFNNSLGEFLLDMQNGNTDAIAGYPSLTIGAAPGTGFILTEGLRGSANGGLQRQVSYATNYVYPVGTIDHGFNAVSLDFDSIATGGGTVKGKFSDSTSNPSGSVGEISQYCNDCPQNAPNNTGYNRYFASNACNSRLPQWVILDDVIKSHGYWSFASSNTGYKYEIEVFPNNFISSGNSSGALRAIKYESSYGSDPSGAATDWEPYIESTISDTNDLLTYTMNMGCYSGSGVPGGMYKDFSHFMMGEASGGDALPVQLLNLAAAPIDNKYIQVTWSTAIEINNAGFRVMRGTDGISFSEIAWVDGHGNSTEQQFYTDNDLNVTAGIIYYYKLEQVDNNGNVQTSPLVSASLTSGSEFTVSDFMPNPSVSQSKLLINSPSLQNIEVQLYDELGRKISDRPYSLTPGENNLNFDTQMLSGAVYTAILSTASTVYSRNLVVVRR